jgi:3',5'-cyclic AMP phosphodiesterase CpdA
MRAQGRRPSEIRLVVATLAVAAACILPVRSVRAQAAANNSGLPFPLKNGSVRFLVLGDTGRGDKGQYDTAKQMIEARAKFPYEFAILLGDNMYGSDGPRDYTNKFVTPYKPLLDAGIKFYGALGNHDNPNQRSYSLFNMNGERYYTFRASAGGLSKLTSGGVRFFALDSNYLNKEQLDWIDKQLGDSSSEWKICYFHHPLYSSGKTHGSALETRAVLEPLFVKHGVSLVLTGHDHIYERIKPQQGIYYFVSGAGGSLRKGDLHRADFTEAGFDQDFQFMLVEIDGADMYFQTVTRAGQTIDSGVIHRAAGLPASAPVSPLPVPSDAPVVEPAPVQPTPSPASPPPKPSPSPTPSASPR